MPAVSCRSLDPSEVVTRFPGARCPWVLLGGKGPEVRLISTDLDAGAPFVATAPASCRDAPCLFDGIHTEAGPLMIAAVRGPQSEMPVGVVLGLVAGGKLQFVDLWQGAGDPVAGDGTILGPAFALRPYVCGAEVGLFVEARLNAARGTDPPPSLVAREAIYAADAAEPKPVADKPKHCRAAALPLP